MSEIVAYKILSAPEYDLFRREGVFEGSPADLADGYIHLSTAAQLEGTLAKHYAGRTDLILAALDLGALGDAVRWEESRGGEVFPHLYGSLPIAAVRGAGPVARAQDGLLLLPV